VLAPVCASFTVGLRAKDLEDATALLDELDAG